LNEKEAFSDDLYNKKDMFKCPMIPTDDDPKHICKCGKEASEIFLSAEEQDTKWWCEDCEKHRETNEVVIKSSAFGLL